MIARSFVAVMGSVLLAACSGNDITESPATTTDGGQAIAFDGLLGQANAVTRASSPLAADGNITTFRVYAFKNDAYDTATESYTSFQTVMNGYRVVWNAAAANAQGGRWEYIDQGTGAGTQTVKFWDYGARAYRFVGYAPADAPAVSYSLGGSPAAAMLQVSVDATEEDEVPLIADWWMSTGNTTVYPGKEFGKPVVMSFRKPLSRVRFMFTFGAEAQDLSHDDLSDMSLRPFDGAEQIARCGTISYSYPLEGTQTSLSWSVVAAAGSGAKAIEAFTEDYTEATPRWYTVLPRHEQQAYKLTVNVGGEERTAEVPATMTTWLPGYDYTYVFKITEGGGVTLSALQTAVRDWTNNTPTNHEVYNW